MHRGRRRKWVWRRKHPELDCEPRKVCTQSRWPHVIDAIRTRDALHSELRLTTGIPSFGWSSASAPTDIQPQRAVKATVLLASNPVCAAVPCAECSLLVSPPPPSDVGSVSKNHPNQNRPSKPWTWRPKWRSCPRTAWPN